MFELVRACTFRGVHQVVLRYRFVQAASAMAVQVTKPARTQSASKVSLRKCPGHRASNADRIPSWTSSWRRTPPHRRSGWMQGPEIGPASPIIAPTPRATSTRRHARWNATAFTCRPADHRGLGGARGRGKGRRSPAQVRKFGGDALQLDGKVRRDGCHRGEAAESPQAGWCQAGEAPGRAVARRRGVAGPTVKKIGEPAAKRESAAHLRASMGLSERGCA